MAPSVKKPDISYPDSERITLEEIKPIAGGVPSALSISKKEREQYMEELGIKVFDFESGKNEVLRRFDALMKSDQKIIIISIHGFDVNIGKTRLLSALGMEMAFRGIPFTQFSDENSIYDNNGYTEQMLANSSCGKIVIFLGACSALAAYSIADYRRYRENFHRTVSGELTNINLPVKGSDISVGISRPDRPFPGMGENPGIPVVNFLIRNDKAVNK